MKKVLLFSMIFTWCNISATQSLIKEQNIPDCNYRGGIGIEHLRIYTVGEDFIEYSLSAKGVQKWPSSRDKAPEGKKNQNYGWNLPGEFILTFPEISSTLPDGRNIGFPAEKSPDAKGFVAALYPKGHYSFIPATVLWLNYEYKSVEISAKNNFGIEWVEWSPDSKYVAFIQYNSDDSPKRIMDLFSPHKIFYHDYMLTIVSNSGIIECETLVTTDIPNASARITWDKRIP